MIEFDDEFATAVEWRFRHGMSTADMAKRWPQHTEAAYERALHFGLERRRVHRVAAAMGANV